VFIGGVHGVAVSLTDDITPAAVDVAADDDDDDNDDAGVPGDSLQRLCEGALPVRSDQHDALLPQRRTRCYRQLVA